MCALYGWERILRTDDPRRGGKLAAFVLHMTTKTKLVFGSIEQYVWGVRVWMQSQMVVDPLMGVLFWTTLNLSTPPRNLSNPAVNLSIPAVKAFQP